MLIILWILFNTATPKSWRFDPYTFTFLTLILSLQAAYAAPLILLAQNRQDDRDRVNLEADRDEARQAKADLEYLARELAVDPDGGGRGRDPRLPALRTVPRLRSRRRDRTASQARLSRAASGQRRSRGRMTNAST